MRTLNLLLVSFVLTWFMGAVASAAEPRPNIVFFIADDLGWADCSIHGGRDVPMPNLDRLAADGMTFDLAFVASPSCAPSRAALLTALMPARNGAMANHATPRKELQTWPGYFKALGYETAAIGKTAHYTQVKNYGFDHFSHFNYHQDDCVEAAVNWLTERRSDRPLCLIVGTNWPHVPWPNRTPFDPAKIFLPPNLFDTPETRHSRARYLQAVANADRDLGMVYDAAKNSLGDNLLFAFSSDHGAQLPFGKWNLYDAGIRTPLVIAWPGKIKPKSRSTAIVSWIDLLPTFLAAGGGDQPKDIDGKSFLPVLLGRSAGHRDRVFVTHSADGKMNRYPIRGVRTAGWKYIRNLDPALEHHTHIDLGKPGPDGPEYFSTWVERAKTDNTAAAVVKRYHIRPAEELYDLKADPWELHNLAADPAQANRLKAFRAELDLWMAEQGDQGMEAERAIWAGIK